MLRAVMRTVVMAVAVVGTHGVANAQLQGRDIDGDGTVDAYYDVQQDISWLADANYYATVGLPPAIDHFTGLPVGSAGSSFGAGAMNQWHAQAFVDGLVVHGVDGWRLPDRLVPVGSDDYRCGPTACHGWTNWPSELSVLASELAGSPGPFSNVQNGWYFTATSPLTIPGNTFGLVNVLSGTSSVYDAIEAYGYAWAVRDGDVGSIAPVPEPSTYALMLCGLVAVGVAARRRSATTD